MDPVEAVNSLRRADSGGSYDFAHVYGPSGTSAEGHAMPEALPALPGPGARIGMIDGPVEKRHAALLGADITAARFAGKSEPPGSPHGTAIASLLVGKDRDFTGYGPGAKLYAADVYGGDGNGGTASDIARALNWMAANRIAVTNISLAGPSNRLLEAAVKAFVQKGFLLVASVGNDGPAAAPNYPAAYPGVIAVTSVDRDGHIQIDANSGGRYAALGVNVRAAALPRGYAQLTGTSYATPAVAAHLAALVDGPDPAKTGDAASRLAASSVPIEAGSGKTVFLLR
jgi:subtilisin family serine protease